MTTSSRINCLRSAEERRMVLSTEKLEHVKHEFAPVYDEHSRVLILGTMPSPKSRERGFYYSHPQNRFWKVLAALFDEHAPETTEEKRSFSLRNGIALWDVLAECEISGAADSTIRAPKPNDIPALLEKTDIAAVFTSGTAAAALLKKFFPEIAARAIPLPSTSPANARAGFEQLKIAYGEILHFLGKQ